MSYRRFFSYACAGLFSFSPLSAERHSLSATEARYEQDTLSLKGDVLIDHDMGQLEADTAFLTKSDLKEKIPFSMIDLKGEVRIRCKNGSRLNADEGKLNFFDSSIILESKEGKSVRYKREIEKHNESTPFVLEADSIRATFREKTPTISSESEYEFTEVKGNGNVSVSYGTDLTIRAGQTVFSEIEGILRAYPSDAGQPCELIYAGQTSTASKIEVSRNGSSVRVDNPEGYLPAEGIDKNNLPLFLSSGHIFLNRENQTITLKDRIKLRHEIFGSLMTREELILEYATEPEEKNGSMKKLTTRGKTVIVKDDSLFVSQGPLCFDAETKRITVNGNPKQPLDPEPVAYRNGEFELFAETAFIEYEEEGNLPKRLGFQKNVKMRSTSPTSPKQFALADELLYFPSTETWIFSAKGKNNVLFWDETEGTTVSAKEIQAKKNPETGELEIRGIGNIRLHFSPEEQQRRESEFPDFPQP